MSEAKKVQDVMDPFDPESYATGGGLWDGKEVTITRAVAKSEALKYKDGKPVMEVGRDGKPTGKQSIQTGLFISGIAEGEDKERTEVYGSGRLVPTPDGENFKTPDGTPLQFHANSGLGKLSAALKAAGYDTKNLVVGFETLNGAQSAILKFSNLVGSKFIFKAETKKGKDGKVLQDKKGYDKQSFYPVKFTGVVAGASAGAASVASAPGQASPVAAKAEAAVLKVLAGIADGKATRADLVKKLAAELAGDPDSNAVIGLVVNDGFHKGKPWKYDGATASL